jgi:hypothetical protein
MLMKNKLKISLTFLISVFIFSCQQNESSPTTDIETAGAFMQDIWKMDFDKAEKLLLKDETNNQVFSRFEQYMKAKPATELDKYKNAEFIINDTKPINDSVSIINYSGSFNKQEKTPLKLVRKNNKWLVDIKYTIPQTDSTQK